MKVVCNYRRTDDLNPGVLLVCLRWLKAGVMYRPFLFRNAVLPSHFEYVDTGGRPSPPEAANNRCKTILAFQEGSGTHMCFGMFVKEYNDLAQVYIDSVDSTPLLEGENGVDRQKTMTSIVLAYMNHAKLRGFKRLYLRVAPPTDENSFIFTRRLPNVRFRASMHLSLWFKYIVQAASRNGIVHSSKWSTSAIDLEFPTWMLREVHLSVRVCPV